MINAAIVVYTALQLCKYSTAGFNARNACFTTVL
jgi:hypothetical protein